MLKKERGKLRGNFTIIKKDGDWWLGWVEEVPGANAQEKTKEELMISFKEAAKDIFGLHRQAAKQEMAGEFEVPLLI